MRSMSLLFKNTCRIFFALLAPLISGCASFEDSISVSLVDKTARQPNERVDAISAEPAKPFKIIGYLAIRTLPEYEPHVVQAFIKKASQSGADAIILSMPGLGQVPKEGLMLVGDACKGFDNAFRQSYESSAREANRRAEAEERRKVVFKATMIVYNSPNKT